MQNLNQLDLEQFMFEVEQKLAVTESQNDCAIVRTISVNVYQMYINGKIEAHELCEKFSELLLDVGV